MASAHDDDLIFDWNLGDDDLDPRRIVTFDDETLRDGLQNPSVRNPTIAQKIELVRLMDGIGIHTVNIGLPGAGDRHYTDCLEICNAVKAEGMRIEVNVACRTMISDVEPVRRIMDETGVRVLANCFIGSSPIRQYTEGWTLDVILKHVDESLGWAKEHGVPFTLVTEDTTRSKPADIARLYNHAIGLGAERIVVCDTCGHATPHGTYRLVSYVRGLVDESGRDVKIDWHGHRDRGLSIVNCIAAVKAGADQVHGALLGIGERAGNAPTDLVLINFKLLGWIDNDLHGLPELVAKAAEYLGVSVPPNYPVFGHDAFLTGTGVHAAAVIKALKKGDAWLADRVYSGVPAGEFGLEQRIGIGPMSGKSNVYFWMSRNGYDEKDEALAAHLFECAKSADHLLSDAEAKQRATDFGARRASC